MRRSGQLMSGAGIAIATWTLVENMTAGQWGGAAYAALMLALNAALFTYWSNKLYNSQPRK